MSELTVLMSVYNGMKYLPGAVESILNQEVADFELLIVNDGSTDGSGDYLDRLKDRRVRVIHQANGGLSSALNRGIEICRTPLLARMDADDLSLPGRLEKQMQFLQAHPAITVVGTQITNITPRGSIGYSPPLPCRHESIHRHLLAGRHALCHGSLMFRTDALRRIGGYRVEDVGEDMDLYLRLCESCRAANLDQVLYAYRIHPDSINSRSSRRCRLHYDHARQNARCRARGRSEIPFEQFLARQKHKPRWRRWADRMDEFAFGQYRKAICEILDRRRIGGRIRLAFSACCSPSRTWGRLLRTLSGTGVTL